MVLDPLVAVTRGPVVIVHVLVAGNRKPVAVLIDVMFPEEGIWRCERYREGHVLTRTREELLVSRVPRETEGVAQVVGYTVIEDEIVLIPVGKLISLPVQLVVEHEIVVRPLQTLSQTGGEAVNLHLLVVAEYIQGQI